MAGFLYYVAGRHQPRTPSGEELTRWGLAHLVGANLAIRETVAGPEGQAEGLILAVEPASLVEGGQAPAVGFYPERQEWAPTGAGDQQENSPPGKGAPLVAAPPTVVGVGWEQERPPGPVDLQRPELLLGHDVKLDDGNTWHVPAARYLPRKIKMDSAGNISYRPCQKFEPFADLVDRCWRDYRSDIEGEEHEQRLTEGEQFRLAAGFLSLNYRVSTIEISELELFTDAALLRVLEAVLDIPAFVDMAKAYATKKKASV